MKIIFKVFIFSGCCLLHLPLLAQNKLPGPTYYVVIGAFTYEQNAKSHVKWAKANGLQAQYKFNGNRNLYYVFTMKDVNPGMLLQEAERIRKAIPKLNDTWVFIEMLDGPASLVIEDKKPLVATEKIVDPPNNNSSNPTVQPETVFEAVASSPEPAVDPEGRKGFFFKLFEENGPLLTAPIEVIDLDLSSLGGIYPSNEKILLKPVNKSGRMMVQSKVFGYRLQQVEFDFKHPTDSAGITLDSGIFTIPMKLKPVVQGDIAIMFNIFFFKDAGIMRPDSRYEVTALLDMMKKFPTREIKIHGHTNGNSHGKILSRDKKTNNFFSLTGSQESSGSAVKLSALRAECIRDYLLDNGIDKNRLSIMAWGGKKMIYKPLSEKAKENVRVEVEVVKE